MRVRAAHPDDQESLRPLGGPDDDPAAGVVFVAGRGFAAWDAVEEELAEAFQLAQAASVGGSPVVFVVDTDAMLGRCAPLDAMVATGLVAGARCLAFEGLRDQRHVGVIATDRSDAAGDLGEAVQFAVTSRAALGQVLPLGIGHAGAMFP